MWLGPVILFKRREAGVESVTPELLRRGIGFKHEPCLGGQGVLGVEGGVARPLAGRPLVVGVQEGAAGN